MGSRGSCLRFPLRGDLSIPLELLAFVDEDPCFIRTSGRASLSTTRGCRTSTEEFERLVGMALALSKVGQQKV